MRTPFNKENFNERVIEKKKINSDFSNGFFEFILKKKDVIPTNKSISILRCNEAFNLYLYDDDGKRFFYTYDFCFDDTFPFGEKEDAEVEEGDILNIRTIINSELDFPPLPDVLESSNGILLYDEDTRVGNTYLATVLIELDPL